MKRIPPKAGWRLWLGWVLMTMIGWYVGIQSSLAATSFIFQVLYPYHPKGIALVFLLVISGAIGGLVFGLSQWIILRGKLRKARLWILSGVIAMAISWPVTGNTAMGENVSLFGILLGTSLGIVQSFGLARWGRLSLLWILVTAVAWYVGIGSIQCRCDIMNSLLNNFLGVVIWLSIPGIIAGMLTGVAFIWLLRHPVSQDHAISAGSLPPTAD